MGITNINKRLREIDILNPNCSEATIRINVSKLSKKEVESIEKFMERIEQEEDWDVNSGSSWRKDTIFGIDCITVKGDYPFNHGEELERELNKFPFANKIELEYDE